MHTFDGSIVSLFLAPSILLALKPRNPLASIFMKLHYRKQYLKYLKEHATSNRTLLTTIKTFTFYDALVMISKAYRALTRQILHDSWTNSNVLFDASTHQYTEPELSLNDIKFKYSEINNLVDEITMDLETLDSTIDVDDADIEQWNNDDIVINTYTNDDSMDKISSPLQHFHQNNKQPIKIEYTDDDGNIKTHEFDELNDNNSSDDNKSVIYGGQMNTIVNEISDDNDEDDDDDMDFNGNVDENTDMHENDDDENMDFNDNVVENTDMHENDAKKMDFNDNVAESINMHHNNTNNDGHNTEDWLINDKQSMNIIIHEISNDKNDKNVNLNNGNVAENTDIQNDNINNDEYIAEDFELYINNLIEKDFSPKPPITPIANITENLDNIHSNELIADENACDAPINLKPTFNIIENLQIYNNATNQLTTTTATTTTNTNIDEPLDLSIKKNDTIYYTCARVDIIETPSVAPISNNIINEETTTNTYKRKHTRKNNKPYKLNLKNLNSTDDDDDNDDNGAADDDDDEEDTNDETTLNHNVVTTTLDKEHDTNLFANINKQIDSTSTTNMINTNDDYNRSYKKIVDYFNTLSEYETIPIEDEYNLTISSVGYLAYWCNKNNHIQYKFNLFDLINDIILHYKPHINK